MLHSATCFPLRCRFRVLNLRTDFKFVFLRNGLQFPVVAAESERVANANPNEPLQAHLSLTGRTGCVGEGEGWSWGWGAS